MIHAGGAFDFSYQKVAADQMSIISPPLDTVHKDPAQWSEWPAGKQDAATVMFFLFLWIALVVSVNASE